MNIDAIATLPVQKIQAGELFTADDMLAIEEPLEIQVLHGMDRQLRKISVTMRTPGHDAALAAGFLFTEGILRHPGEIEQIIPVSLGANVATVVLKPGVQPLLQKTERNFYTTSSCGVCGKASIDAIKTVSAFDNLSDDLHVTPAVLHGLQTQLLEQQAVFAHTGGLHASALFDRTGKLLMVREDVGRHNALDKLIGAQWLDDQLPLNNHILLLSGRASFELIQKAAMAGIRIIAAVGAPSSLAVSLAREYKMSLIGFLRTDRFNIYCGGERIELGH
ncbi:formate dehydrogenase accessory sulfurtransferase FdhD [Paraflavitalea pollutisoli]|uniref:formate dehydrogenase accessory sulfurtransferase FdhD n=1 Tax=Paraflavitalea pollutisoli TaxID=3034143 RepID=UPI0023EAB0D4|nr:formate dehydrogenase accessory sulfurtransferase FdhD [Paraflavitalea sp. H1-2-19X]